MPAAKQSINPDVLAWALKQAGVSKDELARDLGVSSDVLERWFSRDDAPGMTQLRKISRKLRRPTSFFFLPKVPRHSPTEAAFRHPLGSKGKRSLNSDEVAELRSAQRRQKIAAWAAENLEELAPELPKREKSAEATALRVQQWLLWNVEFQVKATSKNRVTKLIRRSLEDQGVMVLQVSMGRDSCRGFSIYHQRVPVIAYNGSSQTAAARTFTLLHELGHLLAHEQAVCASPQDAEERWCDRFAAAFLLPKSHLRDYLAFKKYDYVEHDDVDIVRLISQRYKASFQCVALRLIDLGVADWSLYESVRNSPLEIEKGGFGGEAQTTEIIRMREYGLTFPRLVLAARDRGKLAEIDARKYLNVDGEQMTSLQHRLTEV
ncbi:ImmA/IrrE family metallo-endopeptidase [Streptomyces ovatisporus]|uniref:ImmA/IrrE family metallo-endopeptidase n=1 Tax=Streptomyces ovatisporus TaxID=1128682 RepID=A0ABV9A7B1_9ACTN